MTVETRAEGQFTATSTKVVNGFRFDATTVGPTPRSGVSVNHSALTFANFAAFDAAPAANPPAKLTMTGAATALVRPIPGQSTIQTGLAGGTPIFSISTPVTGFENYVLTDVDVTLVAGASTFNLTVDAADLDAFNGVYTPVGGPVSGSNFVGGTITLDGQQIALAATTPLDSAFDQAAFDASYAAPGCVPDLFEPVPAAGP